MKTSNLTIQDLFTSSKQQWLEDARLAAQRLLKVQECITIEDVLSICPRPKFLHQNITGNVFKSREFKPTGRYRKSKRSISHGRDVKEWTLKEGYKNTRSRDYEVPDIY